MKKRGQSTMSLPFGIIFSIILIVVFIIIAFIAINHFLDIGKCAGVGQFYEGLQVKVNDAQSSQESGFNFKIDLPSGISKVCFANLTGVITNKEDYNLIAQYDIYEANTFLIPPEKACNMPWKMTKYLNITKITEARNPYCVDVSRELRIEKGFYDRNVVIR